MITSFRSALRPRYLEEPVHSIQAVALGCALAATLALAPRVKTADRQTRATSTPRPTAAQVWRVKLDVSWGTVQDISLGIAVETSADGRMIARLPGGLEATVERVAEPELGVFVIVPGADPERTALLDRQYTQVTLKRKLGQADHLSYLLGYRRSQRDGKTREILTWVPMYRPQGHLRVPGCEVNVAVLDLNGDGVINEADGRQGTSIGIDVDGDARFWGAAEWRRTGEIIELCGRPMEVAEINSTDPSISFKPSALAPAVVGQPAPSFAVTVGGGRTIRTSDYRGRALLLDFWASWCAPCVASLQHIDALAKEHAETLSAIGINVDEPSRREAAAKVISDKQLSFPQAIRGFGDNDYLWKVFGSMKDMRQGIPLYVLIDGKGILRYAGFGGDNLADLKAGVAEAVK
jgi:thiol-disulfide isomerase/thioredoxin